MKANLLAVYGSLRLGFGLPGLPDQRGARLIDRGPCVMRGLLYDLGDYPGMIEGDGRVIGELVEIVDAGALRMLDDYEGFDVTRPAESHFIRRSLRLLEPSIDVWVYLYNGEVSERQRVASGDWAVHMSSVTRLRTPSHGESCMTVTGSGTAADPWVLRTPPGTSEYHLHRDREADPPALVCTVGKSTLRYHLRCIEDLHAMLTAHGDWMELGSADEQKPAKEGTVEAWARSEDNPVGGWYGLKKGMRGRFAMYVPPLLEHLGLVELEHNPRNNRVRALPA